MFSKIIFVFATVCVINASVITDNVFDGNPETEVQAASPKSCNFQACVQLCRRLKFPGGACVNGRCKCDNFLNAEDGVAEKSLSDLEDLVSLKDDYEPEVAAIPKKCNLRACEQLCRRLKFPGGTCVNGRCKCDNFLNAEDGVSEESVYELEESVLQKDDPETEFAMKPSRCHLKLCNLLCRKLKNTRGACVDGRCKCDEAIKPEVYDESLSNPEDSVSQRACNNQKCNQLCRKKKFRGGACIGPNCYCNKFLSQQDGAMTDPAEELSDDFLNTEDAVSEPLSSVEDSDSPRRCTQEACNVLCRKLKYQEGVCIASRCRCKNYTPLQKDAMSDLAESLSLQDDFFSDDLLDTEDEVLENPLPVSELSEDQTERRCNMRACEQLCRRLKFPGGACVNGRCKCDNFFRTEDADAVDEYSELAPRRVCRIKKCNRTCTRRGYEFARCVNGHCECYNKQTDPSFLNEGTIDEQDDSNHVMRINEDADAVDEYSEFAPRRVCRIRDCNRTCTRRGYEFARCINGICKCYNKIQKDPDFLNEVTNDEQGDPNVFVRTA